MRILVMGLPGTGKSTYVRNEMGPDDLAYDLDAITGAFRLRRPHEEVHSEARRLANDLLPGWLANADRYAVDVYVIRTAPTPELLSMINPDRAVVCCVRYARRPVDNLQALARRIMDAEDWCRRNGVPLTRR